MFNHSLTEKGIRIDYDKTCSCDWFIYSSPKISVTPLEELRITYRARSEKIRFRHGKLVFIDAYDHVIDTAFIFEVEETEKEKWHTYEQLVTVPEGAEKVLLQFWARGNKEFSGLLELEDISLERYNDYITLDYVIIKEVGEEAVAVSEAVNVINKNRMKFQVIKPFSRQVLWNSYLSPTSLWRKNNQTYDIALNGITMGYILDERESTIEVVLRKIYYAGVFMHMTTALLGIIIILNIYYRRRHEKSLNRR